MPCPNANDGEVIGVERLEYPAQRCSVALHVIGVLILCLLIWSAIARIDLVAESKGKLIPKGDVKIIQPPSDGTILKVFVQEGQRVKTGDKLALMDRLPLAAELETTKQNLALRRAECQRHENAIKALRTAIQNPAGIADIQLEVGTAGGVLSELYSAYKKMQEDEIDSSQKLINSGTTSAQQNLNEKLSRLTEQRECLRVFIEQKKSEFSTKEKEMRELNVALKQQVEQAKLARQKLLNSVNKTKEQVKCYEAIYNGGAISRVTLLDVSKNLDDCERSLLETDAKIASDQHRVSQNALNLTELKAASKAVLNQSEADMKRIDVDLSNTKMQVRNIDRNFSLAGAEFRSVMVRAKAAIQKETDSLADCIGQVQVLESALTSAKHAYEIAEIHAPEDGIATAIKVKVNGQVVRRGEELMTIVPSKNGFFIEACVANRDFGFISLNQTAKIKLDAFPYQDYGIIQGKVVEIESQPQQDKDRDSYFKIRIEPSRDWVTVQKNRVALTNGMTAQVDLIIRSKTVLEMLFEPLTKLSDISLKN